MSTVWSKANPSWGRPLRLQRNIYAMRVTLIMTRGKYECPCCTRPFDMGKEHFAEVDKATPSLDYCPGNIAYICIKCNQTRGRLQRVERDWPGVQAYRAKVRAASAGVAIPGVTEARAEWLALTTGEGDAQYTNRYA